MRDACQQEIEKKDAEMDALGVDIHGINYRGSRCFLPYSLYASVLEGWEKLKIPHVRDEATNDIVGCFSSTSLHRSGFNRTGLDKGEACYGLRLSPDLPAHHWPDEAAAWIKYELPPSHQP